MKESGGALSAPSGVWSSLGIRKGFLERCDFCGKREVVTRHQPGCREVVRRARSAGQWSQKQGPLEGSIERPVGLVCRGHRGM